LASQNNPLESVYVLVELVTLQSLTPCGTTIAYVVRPNCNSFAVKISLD
jgi:hypothetical protein